MTELFDRTILEIFQQAALAAVAASTNPSMPIKLAGFTFQPPDTAPWLEVIMIPTNGTNDFLGDEKNYQGAVRLIIHWPNDTQGAYPAIDALASVAGYFSKGLQLQNIQISANPDFGGVLEHGNENLYPATLRYQCFRS